MNYPKLALNLSFFFLIGIHVTPSQAQTAYPSDYDADYTPRYTTYPTYDYIPTPSSAYQGYYDRPGQPEPSPEKQPLPYPEDYYYPQNYKKEPQTAKDHKE